MINYTDSPSPSGEGRVRPATTNGLYAAKGTIGFKSKKDKMAELRDKVRKLHAEATIHWEYILHCKETESPNFKYHKDAYNDKMGRADEIEHQIMELKYEQ